MNLTNRRTSIGAAGATAALADNASAETQATPSVSDLKHDDPSGDPKTPQNNDPILFYKLVVIKMLAGGVLDVTYASFGADRTWSKKQALKAIQEKINTAPTDWDGDVGKLSDYEQSSLGSAFDLGTFGFRSKHWVFFYCFDAGTKFPKMAKDAIKFVDVDKSGKNVPISPNKSFHRASVESSKGGQSDQKILMMENHFKDQNGKIDPNDPRKTAYNSFDLYLMSVTGTNPPILITIDPTTGNGNSWDP